MSTPFYSPLSTFFIPPTFFSFVMSSSSPSLEDLFMALPLDERQRALQNMLEKMPAAENVQEAVSDALLAIAPTTPEKPKAIKRELDSPDTPFKGEERKVCMKF